MVSPELLRRYTFFGFMDDAQVKAVSAIAEELTYKAGTAIIETNKPADALFYLIEGSISYYFVVTIDHDPYYKKEYYIADLNAGEMLGISALIEPHIYTATIKADDKCRVIKINAPMLRSLCEADAKLSIGWLRAAARAAMERLDHTRVQLVAAKG